MARSTMARIMGEGQRNGLTPDDIPDGFISWEEHNIAWGVWSRTDRSHQTADDVERMGGFSYRQLAQLLGHNPVTWELREPLRYQQFLLKPEDGPPDLTAPTIIPETAPLRSHIWNGNEQSICVADDDVPDGVFFFDTADGPHCPKCFSKMQIWLNWWVDSGKKTNV